MTILPGKWSRIVVAITLIALTQIRVTHAQLNGIAEDGWHTWYVKAVAAAPEMCCFKWREGNVTRQHCDLDGRDGGYSSSSDTTSEGEGIRIYAFVENGEVRQLRALSRSCAVSAKTVITDLGPVDVQKSIAWLQPLLKESREMSSDIVAAIAVHDGNEARNLLIDIATSGTDQDDREEAIFWMAQARIDETADVIKRFATENPNPEIREHATFAYSQSNAGDVTEMLVRQGRNDSNADVRSQAWFWLAETGAQESEVEIRRALLNDKDENVREEAVFALAQLPEIRAVKALMALVEDRRISMEIREQALFWLGQTESDEAFDYIDRILNSN